MVLVSHQLQVRCGHTFLMQSPRIHKRVPVLKVSPPSLKAALLAMAEVQIAGVIYAPLIQKWLKRVPVMFVRLLAHARSMKACLVVRRIKLLLIQLLLAPIRHQLAMPANKLQSDSQISYCSRVLVLRFVSMDIQREPDPKGDRVQVVLSGKYLSYKTY